MFDKTGERQRVFLQHCKNIVVFLEDINLMEETLKMTWIIENAELLKSIGNSILEVVKAFADMESYSLIRHLNHQNISWTDDVENACNYIEIVTKVVKNILEANEYTAQKKCLCCQDHVFFVPYSQQFLEMHGIPNAEPEFYNEKESLCPNCMGNDRDRSIICFLKKISLDRGNKPVKVLQLAQDRAIAHWINAECPTVTYQSVNIEANSMVVPDISQISELPSEDYDLVLCSLPLLYERAKEPLANELIRILKADGLCLFSTACSVASENNDGEDDFLNMEFIKKLTSKGCALHKYEQDSYSEDAFIGQAVLYILTKTQNKIDDIISMKAADRYDYNMEKPLVSVIMSVYNHEKYVSRAIESVLSQSYENIEFLVADDFSTDKSADEVLKYEAQIDQIHLFKENGFGRIPFLLSIANGKYICVLDSDDYWEPAKIEKQVLYMETHPECGACFTSVRSVNDNEEEIDIQIFTNENRVSAEWINFFFHHGNALSYSSVMIKKELHMRVISHASNFSIIPDYIMWLHVALDHDIHLIEKDLLNYRWHNLNDSKMTDRRLKNEYFEESYCWLEIMKQMDNALFLKVFGDELMDPNVKEAREILSLNSLDYTVEVTKRTNPESLKREVSIEVNPEVNKKIMQEKYQLGRREIFEMLNNL